MDGDETADKDVTRIGKLASRAFLKIEVFAYLVLGLLLALTAMLGVGSAAVSLWQDVQEHINAASLVLTIDRLLFVLMVVEILHTVRVSFRSGTLVCEPFLIVGLIASIRRVLVITLESSQVNQPGKWTPETQGLFNSTMLELGVLGGLILVMVISICLLRYSERVALAKT
jgi:uncharacterized membrane protein (DUF373 family)